VVREPVEEYRGFITGLGAAAATRGEILYFDSKSSHFGQDNLPSATQVALERTDVSARLVAEFPPEARHRLRFDASSPTKQRPTTERSVVRWSEAPIAQLDEH
jgi:hypothetical protein